MSRILEIVAMSVPQMNGQDGLGGKSGRTMPTSESFAIMRMRNHMTLQIAILEKAPTADFALVRLNGAVTLNMPLEVSRLVEAAAANVTRLKRLLALLLLLSHHFLGVRQVDGVGLGVNGDRRRVVVRVQVNQAHRDVVPGQRY